MSKAEKFIEENTRNCSQLHYNSACTLRHCITPSQAREAVEIAKEKVIEKVCEFLDNDLCCYIKAQDFTIEHQRLENDLKQAMKDET